MSVRFDEVVAVPGEGEGSAFRVRIEDGRQPEFVPAPRQTPSRSVVPGFVDGHIHGAFGIDTMDADPAALSRLAGLLVDEGYEGFLPTTVTAGFDDVKRAVEAVPDHPAIWGFHLEGPFISPKYPGAQPPGFILSPPTGPSDWDWVFDHPKLKVVTLAPELPGALALIKRLSQRGVSVSMGHTDATYEEAQAGFAAGATQVTHTFNAMRPFHHREAGMAGFALNTPGLACELIYDREHVSARSAEVLLRHQPTILGVSDASLAAKLPDGDVKMWGHECVVNSGSVRLKSNGALAGSTVLMGEVFANLWADFGPEVATRACCVLPRARLRPNTEPRLWLLVDASGRLVERFPC